MKTSALNWANPLKSTIQSTQDTDAGTGSGSKMVPACVLSKKGRNNYGIQHLLIQEWIFLSNMLMSGLYTSLHGRAHTDPPSCSNGLDFPNPLCVVKL